MSTTNGSIIFPESEWRKIHEYTELCPVEIACMGYAKLDGANVLVDEVFLIPQDISLSSVDFLEKGFPYAIDKAAKEGRIDELRFCWHSHATHPACFSATDEDWIEKIRDSGPIPWFASAVLNKAGNTHGQLDYFGVEGPLSHFASHITVKLDVRSNSMPAGMQETRLAEIEQFCTRKTYESGSKKKGDKKSGKSSAGDSSSNEWEQQLEAWNQGITAREHTLHRIAKEKGWECYINEGTGDEALMDVAHYWDGTTKSYEGCAAIPVTLSGDYAIPIKATVIDGQATEVEGDDDELIPLSDAEEAMLQRALDCGML